MKTTLKNIALENNLTLIETTDQSSGNFSNMEYAIIGFNNFEEAVLLAEKYNLSIEVFKQKDGWGNLYYRTDKETYEAFIINTDYYDDDYNVFSKYSLKNYYSEEISRMLENFNDMNSLSKFLDKQKEIINELEKAEDNELVITYKGRYKETIKQNSMCWKHDTCTLVIGVKFNEEYKSSVTWMTKEGANCYLNNNYNFDGKWVDNKWTNKENNVAIYEDISWDTKKIDGCTIVTKSRELRIEYI